MQGGFVVNPRRVPRAPARCRATVTSSAGMSLAETEDLGAHGCLLRSPQLLRIGDRIQLEITNALVTGALAVSGHVVWASAAPPWRLGVAFDEAWRALARDWFERLVATHPAIGAFRRVPDRIPVDAAIHLGPPPRRPVDLTRDELALLRAVGDGVPLRELVARFGDRWGVVQRSLFALMARQHLTLNPGAAAPAAAWAQLLAERERALPPASPATDEPAGAPAPGPARPEPPAPRLRPVAQLRRAAGPAPAAGHAPDFAGAGVGWRGAARPRPPDAQACLDRARAELEAGRVQGALALLRQALALAPGDPEIAGALGQLAFKDRTTTGQ